MNYFYRTILILFLIFFGTLSVWTQDQSDSDSVVHPIDTLITLDEVTVSA